MIQGLDKFREHFAGFTGHYVLIGGAATDLVMAEAGVEFRATKDFDIVLCVEALDAGFAEVFWEFVKAGGYQNQQRSTGEKVFYRFDRPKDKRFPYMLELFSRVPDSLVLGDDSHLTPILIDEDVSSLSAILLDGVYYQFLHEHKKEIDGVSVVSEACLIPLKAKAWLDLTARRDEGAMVDSKTIKKHKNDIFRLFQIIQPDSRYELSDVIADDMQNYLSAISQELDVDLKSFGLKGLGVADVVSRLKKVYELPEKEKNDATD